MSESISTTFEYLGGTVDCEISAKHAEVNFTRDDKTVIIEDSYGDVFRFDNYNYSLLHGAAKTAFEEKQAREYSIDQIGRWILFAQESLENE